MIVLRTSVEMNSARVSVFARVVLNTVSGLRLTALNVELLTRRSKRRPSRRDPVSSLEFEYCQGMILDDMY